MNTNVLKNRRTIRTTVTLEADVADFIEKKISQNIGLKEKQLINRLLRSGIKKQRALNSRCIRRRKSCGTCSRGCLHTGMSICLASHLGIGSGRFQS